MLEYEITELQQLSGRRTKIYTILPKGETTDLFSQFVKNWQASHPEEVKDIAMRLWQMGHKFGARADFFRHEEGKPGDGVCAFFDRPGAKLRLYCVRYGSVALLLGSGGPKKVRAWQDDPILRRAAERMIAYAKDVNRRLSEGDTIYWSRDKTEILGNLKIYDDEEDE